jgi:hypothetical protein
LDRLIGIGNRHGDVNSFKLYLNNSMGDFGRAGAPVRRAADNAARFGYG